MGGRVHVQGHVQDDLQSRSRSHAPSVTVVSRHQPGASEWLAQNPFLIPRISKVSSLKKITFAAARRDLDLTHTPDIPKSTVTRLQK